MEELRRIRKERGLSQAKLAARAGLDPATVNQIELGKRKPTTSSLEKLAEALDVELAELFKGYAMPPKAQAPLWSDEAQPERHSFDFREARKWLEEYCARWERRLAERAVDDRAIEEFMATAQGWIPTLEVAVVAEVNELESSGLGWEGDDEGGELPRRSEMWQANARYLALFDDMMRMFAAGLNDDKVVRIDEARDRLKNMPRKAAV